MRGKFVKKRVKMEIVCPECNGYGGHDFAQICPVCNDRCAIVGYKTVRVRKQKQGRKPKLKKEVAVTEKEKIAQLKQELEKVGLVTWPSWSGFGISTSWPDPKHARELEQIKAIINSNLPPEWVIQGPVFAAGGALVVYVWPKSDSHIAKMRRP